MSATAHIDEQWLQSVPLPLDNRDNESNPRPRHMEFPEACILKEQHGNHHIVTFIWEVALGGGSSVQGNFIRPLPPLIRFDPSYSSSYSTSSSNYDEYPLL